MTLISPNLHRLLSIRLLKVVVFDVNWYVKLRVGELVKIDQVTTKREFTYQVIVLCLDGCHRSSDSEL